MRLVYFGSGAFGLPTLEHLARQHQIAGVVTQPDKPAGRGGALAATPIGAWAAEHLAGIPLLKPAKVSDPAVIEQIRALATDAWVVIAFGQKLPRELLEGRFALNLHASLLPRWRGAAPINAAILGGDTETGNSVITLADRMDAGMVLATSHRAIDPLITAGELHDLLAADGPALVESVLAKHASGLLQPQAQDETYVTIASKLSRQDDHVDFTQKADFVRRQVHALTPWPGVTSAIVAPEATPDKPPPMHLKILRVQPVPGIHQQDPGTILDIAAGRIACAHHTQLKILEVQPPGRNVMRWEDFARRWPEHPPRFPRHTREGVGVMLTLWDLLDPLLSKLAPSSKPKPPVVLPRSGGIVAAPSRRPVPRRRKPSEPVEGSMQARYDVVAKALLDEHGIRVRKWRKSMSGVAWYVVYRDGTRVNLIEAPRPRGPMSAAIFLHEIGHHAIGFNVYKPRCLEEYHAWKWSLEAMEHHGLNITDAVRLRMHRSLHYAVQKALRRGIKSIPHELIPFMAKPPRTRQRA